MGRPAAARERLGERLAPEVLVNADPEHEREYTKTRLDL
jgi:hypothetical protein